MAGSILLGHENPTLMALFSGVGVGPGLGVGAGRSARYMPTAKAMIIIIAIMAACSFVIADLLTNTFIFPPAKLYLINRYIKLSFNRALAKAHILH
jgi:hypothetical protein